MLWAQLTTEDYIRATTSDNYLAGLTLIMTYSHFSCRSKMHKMNTHVRTNKQDNKENQQTLTCSEISRTSGSKKAGICGKSETSSRLASWTKYSEPTDNLKLVSVWHQWQHHKSVVRPTTQIICHVPLTIQSVKRDWSELKKTILVLIIWHLQSKLHS